MSFGLVGLRERVYFLDGSIDIESKPGHGTTIRARIPLGATGHSPERTDDAMSRG